MPGKSSQQRRALETIKARILPVFEAAGYDFISPDILQPADIFLDRSGEDIRTRTFVFADPEGRELCLRPDLTVPTCRYHLELNEKDPAKEQRYCYWGPVFRYQPPNRRNALQPQEYEQTGIEWFGTGKEAEAEADAAMLALSLKALSTAGLQDYQVQMGDLGLLHGLLESIEMPARWRRRLKHHFWRPRAFRELLHQLSSAPRAPETSTMRLIDEMISAETHDVEALVANHIEARELPFVGSREIADIAMRLKEKQADRQATPLAKAQAGQIDAYLALRGTPADIGPELKKMAKAMGGAFAASCERFFARLDLFRHHGIDTHQLVFSSVFGRSLEYYTGFVFQVEKRTGDDPPVIVAGGGRYDDLLGDIGTISKVPAVGCAVHTERLAQLLEASSHG